MKYGLILLLFLIGGIARGGDTIYGTKPSQFPAILINGVVALAGSRADYDGFNTDTSYSNDFWISNLYLSTYIQIENNYSIEFGGGTFNNYLTCVIYIQKGDSVTVIDTPGILNQTFYRPDTIKEIESSSEGCGGSDLESDFTIIIQYLSGPLEGQYLQMVAAQQQTADSLATIQNIQSDKQSIIYPNPTTGLLNFTNYYPNNGTAGVEIFDVSGREVLQQSFEVSPGLQTNLIDMGNLPNGVYLVQYTVDGNRRMEKVIKM